MGLILLNISAEEKEMVLAFFTDYMKKHLKPPGKNLIDDFRTEHNMSNLSWGTIKDICGYHVRSVLLKEAQADSPNDSTVTV